MPRSEYKPVEIVLATRPDSADISFVGFRDEKDRDVTGPKRRKDKDGYVRISVYVKGGK